MFRWRQKQVRSADAAAEGVYAAVVGRARTPAYYRDFGAPDTVEGRFDMIVLYLAVVVHRLAGEGEAGRELQQALGERFFADMDRSLRELGVSDLGMARRMRHMVEGFYGRLAAYAPAIADRDGRRLAEAIQRNVLGGANGNADALAEAALAASRALAGQSGADILAGRLAMANGAGPETAT